MDNKVAGKLVWRDVLNSEIIAINTRREVNKAKAVAAHETLPDFEFGQSGVFDTAGLALSGGGIRSAAFGLGALQALFVSGVFPKFDYLSTVSGGGYIGTALTSAMSRNDGKFPFVDASQPLADSDEVKHVRDFSNYLIPLGLRDVLRDITIVLRGLVAIALLVLPCVLLLAALTIFLNPDVAGLYVPPIRFWAGIQFPLFISQFAWTKTLLLITLGFYVFWAFYRSIWQRDRNEFAGYIVRFAAAMLVFFGIVFFLELQPFIISRIYDQTFGFDANPKSSILGWIQSLWVYAAPIIAAVSAFSKKLSDLLKFGEQSTGVKALGAKISGKLVLWIGALAVPVLLWSSYLIIVYWGIPEVGMVDSPQWYRGTLCSVESILRVTCNPDMPHAHWDYILLALAMLIGFLFLSPNSNSLHRLYRDRLEAAFMSGIFGKVKREPGMKLSELKPKLAPFHIINAALNIQGSDEANRRERNADFYHFTQQHCGSEASGYVPTDEVEATNASLTLAAAMAISGAAVSSNMGSATIGPLAPTFSLLNIRLGYWMRNPLLKTTAVNEFYLLKEMFSRLSATDRWLYLTDGGHVENLGVYALLKRRCRLIIAIDAEADPEMSFGALARLERYARIDLGCRLNIYWTQISETHAQQVRDDGKKPGGPHCAIGEIHYANGGSGTLIYVKSSLSGDESNYVRDYARRNKAFPHETTSDQFFNEEQFEAYRALGFHAVHGVFRKDGADVVTVPANQLQRLRSGKHPVLVSARKVLGI